MTVFKKLAVAFATVFAVAGFARAESSVEVKNVHLCCGACYTGVEKAIKKVDGASVKFDKPTKLVTITGKDDATVQKAIDALAAAGYHGDVSGSKFKVTDDSGADSAKVKSVTLTGVHNCCGSCNSAIVKAVKAVSGVTGNTAKSKNTSFEVSGDFSPAELVKSLNAAGFHVKVQK